jgi:hypothetical protein
MINDFSLLRKHTINHEIAIDNFINDWNVGFPGILISASPKVPDRLVPQNTFVRSILISKKHYMIKSGVAIYFQILEINLLFIL